MIIQLKKFGITLTSRQLGKEALAAFNSSLPTVGNGDIIKVNFDGINTFSPSWGDEFLTPLVKKYNEKFILKKSDNPSVVATLKLLEEVNGYKFNIK